MTKCSPATTCLPALLPHPRLVIAEMLGVPADADQQLPSIGHAARCECM
ncbi:MAG: hypothetical protein H6668_17400 [Ardenticatenaceae bacterium]|nr:hypothetical protein [Ardenticatenaceae bacterium]